MSLNISKGTPQGHKRVASHRPDGSPLLMSSPQTNAGKDPRTPRSVSGVANIGMSIENLSLAGDPNYTLSDAHDESPSQTPSRALGGPMLGLPGSAALNGKLKDATSFNSAQIKIQPQSPSAGTKSGFGQSHDHGKDVSPERPVCHGLPSGEVQAPVDKKFSPVPAGEPTSAMPAVLRRDGSASLANREVYLYKILCQRAPVSGIDTVADISKKLKRFVCQQAIKHMVPTESFVQVSSDLYFSKESVLPKDTSKRLRRVDARALTGVGNTTLPARKWALTEADTQIAPGPKEIDFDVTIEATTSDHPFEVGRVRSFFPKDSQNTSMSDSNASRGTLDAVMAFELRKKLGEAGITSTFTHGHRVFSKLHSEIISNTAVKRFGLEGRMVYNEKGNEPTLVWKPCTATFFPEVLVSDFLIAVGGPSVYDSNSSFSHRLGYITSVLGGTRVSAAVASKSKKRIFTITGLDTCTRQNQTALHHTSKKFTMDNMRYPDMICLRGYYGDKQSGLISLPAECCKILPNQAFRHEPPLQAGDISINKKKICHQPDKYVPKQGDPFTAVKANDFQLFYAQVIDTASAVSKDIAHVTQSAWEAFKYELGQRFNGKLEEAIVASTTIERSTKPRQALGRQGEVQLDLQRKLSELLRHANSSNTGVRRVFVIAVPPSLPKEEVDDMKAWCDVQLGAQCCLVSTRELLSRFDRRIVESPENSVPSSGGSAHRQLVKYTGAIARLMFSRALFPAEPKNDSPTQPTFPGDRLLVGLQITDLASCAGGSDTPLGSALGKSHDKFYLLSAVTFDGSSRVNTVVKTSITELSTMGPVLAEMIREANDLSHFNDIVVHMIGHDAFDLGFSERFLKGIDSLRTREKSFDGPSSPIGRIQVVAYSPESKVSSAKANGAQSSVSPSASLVDRPDAALPREGRRLEMGWTDEELLPHLTRVTDMNAELETVFKRPGGDSQPLREAAWRVSYNQSMAPGDAKRVFQHDFPPGEQAHIQHRQLERRALPPILFLTQKATKRAFTRFAMNEKLDSAGKPANVCPIEVPPVHPDLEGSLYYL